MMKIFIRSLLAMTLFTFTLLFAIDTNGSSIVTDNKTNDSLSNLLEATDIVNLSATSANGLTICNFRIKSLPDSASGVLYLADGETKVKVNQNLTKEEAEGLTFDPKEGFVGETKFTYTGIDVHGAEGTIGTVTLPIISADGGNGSGGATSVTTDDKVNPEMLNSLPAVDILDLSGKDAEGVPVNNFIITSLVNAEAGVLYMADGTTAVVVDQNLTKDEANGLKFDPAEDFVGDARFNYQAVDVNGERGNVATVTIPVVGRLTPDNNGSGKDCKCNDYNKSLSLLSNFGLFLIMTLTSLIGLFFARREEI